MMLMMMMMMIMIIMMMMMMEVCVRGPPAGQGMGATTFWEGFLGEMSARGSATTSEMNGRAAGDREDRDRRELSR